MKLGAAGNRGNVFRKKRARCSPKICAGAAQTRPLGHLHANLEALFRSEQGNLTSRAELPNVSEIAKYSIPANSAGNGSGITLLPSPGHCPRRAIMHSRDLPPRSQTDKCLKDAGCGRHPNGPQPREPRGVITHRTDWRRRKCVRRGVRAGAGARRAGRALRRSRRCNFSEICQTRNDSLWGR